MIKIGEIGRIISGSETGRYVMILDDKSNTGGYLILTAADKSMKNDGYDNWVGSFENLKGYFEESQWSINWNGDL